MRLYGLGRRDLAVVLDTLEFSLPFAANERKAQAIPSPREVGQFCAVLRDELKPWCDRFGSRIAVDQLPSLAMSPWQAIAVRARHAKPTNTVSGDDWVGLRSVANRSAAAEILVDNKPDGILIGRLLQRRYWSTTEARLLAQRIVWSHLELLKEHANA